MTSFSPLDVCPFSQIDGDDVAVDVHRLDPAALEQAVGNDVRRTGADRVSQASIALVAHPREGAIRLEAHHSRVGGRLLDDNDRLAHGVGMVVVASAAETHRLFATSGPVRSSDDE